jgi:hypothetical protein
VVANEAAVRLAGVDVGDEVTIATLSPEQVDAEDYDTPRGPLLHLRVVGVTRGTGDLVDDAPGTFSSSPALWDTIDGRADVFTTYLGVRLADGATPADLDAATGLLVGAERELTSLPFDVRTKPARDTVSALAAGIAVFALVAGVATVAVIGQAVVRHVSVTVADHEVLTALGMSRSARRAALVLSVLPVALGGALLAATGALLASPLLPIGLARRAEPSPGLSFDAPVIGLGALCVATLVVAVAAGTAWTTTRSTAAARSRPAARTSTLAAATWQAGAGPVVANGVRLALDRRPPSLPVRTTIGGVSVGILGVVAVLTFTASLDRLTATPARWGFDWDMELGFASDEVGDAARQLADDPALSGVARWDAGFSVVEGTGVRAYGLAPLRGDDIGFSLRSGRQPVSSDEVVVGPATLHRLGIGLGDSVEVAAASGKPLANVHVVGTALFPEIDEGNFSDAVGYFGEGFADHASAPDAFEASQVVVRLAPGADQTAVIDAIAERFPSTDVSAAEIRPRAPRSIGNLFSLRALPRWLAVFVATLGLASLAHIIFTTLRRRQGEFATLRSLGFTGRQTMRCVVWQTVTIGVVGLLIGLPIGLLVGRSAWWAVADPIGVATDVRLPWLGLTGLCVGTLAAGSVLAWTIARRSTQRTIADALRVE